MDAIRPVIASPEPLDAYVGGCARCGYDLRGLIEHRCPECGQEFDPSNSWPRRWLEMRAGAHRNALTCLVSGTAMAAAFAMWAPGRSFRSPASFDFICGSGMLGVMAIVPVVLAVHWCWDEAARRIGRLVHDDADHDEQVEGPLKRMPPALRYTLGGIGLILVMLLWMPALMLAFLWLPPVAVAMHLTESRRTQARLTGALQTPYSIDTRRQFGRYRFWGGTFTVTTTIAWLVMMLLLI